MNSRDMLNQQKQEIARSVPDTSPCRGWGLGTRLNYWWSETFNPFGHKQLQIYNHTVWTVSRLNREKIMICRYVGSFKISSVVHTIGLVWRHFDRVTSKWFCIEEAFNS